MTMASMLIGSIVKIKIKENDINWKETPLTINILVMFHPNYFLIQYAVSFINYDK